MTNPSPVSRSSGSRSLFIGAMIVMCVLCGPCRDLFGVPPGQLAVSGVTVSPEVEHGTRLVAIAAGSAHTIGLTEKGAVVTWGNNRYRQASAPADLSNVVAVAAGGHCSGVLLADGTVRVWGLGSFGQTAVPGGLRNVVKLSIGRTHCMALRSDGSVAEWGGVSSGGSAVPKPENLTNVIAIAAGARHSLAVRSDGSVAGWGYNGQKQAVALAHVTNAVAVAGGENFSIALLSDGSVTGFGQGVTNASAIAASESHGLVLQSDGSIVQLSSGELIGRDEEVMQIAAGGLSDVVLRRDGTWRGFGDNSQLQAISFEDCFGVLAIRSHPSSSTTRLSHFLAMRDDGTVFAWGENNARQIEVPPNLKEVVSIAAGEDFSLAVHGGTVVGWGSTNDNRLAIPAQATNVTAVAAGRRHSLIVREDGLVVAWGSNAYGQAQVPGNLAEVLSVAAGDSHSAALLKNGTVVCWGANDQKQCSVPTGLTGVVALATGAAHTLALTSWGEVVSWGYRQSGIPADLTNVIAISTTGNQSIAVRADGTAVFWGSQSVFEPDESRRNILSLEADAGQAAGIILKQPEISVERLGTGIALSFWRFQQYRYTVEFSSDFPGATWVELKPMAPPVDDWGALKITDPDASTEIRRFYRLQLLPISK